MGKTDEVLEGWDRFNSLIIEEAKRLMLPSFKIRQKELGEAIWNTLFDTGGPTVISHKPSEKTKFFGKIFQGFLEIQASVSTLYDIEIYISSFPYHNKQITKPRHLRYHLENYYSELYLLKERLIAFLTKIRRFYKQDSRHQSILRMTRPTFSFVSSSLKGILETRRIHVHVARFSDKDLDRLESMNLYHTAGFDSSGADRLFDNFYKSTYRSIRSKWKKVLKNNNAELLKLLDIYSKVLIRILFDEKTGAMIYPSDISDI